MSFEIRGDLSLTAENAIAESIAVKLWTGAGLWDVATTSAGAVWFSDYASEADKSFRVITWQGVAVKVTVWGAVAVWDKLKVTTWGKLITTVTLTDEYVAEALEVATADGAIIAVLTKRGVIA